MDKSKIPNLSSWQMNEGASDWKKKADLKIFIYNFLIL